MNKTWFGQPSQLSTLFFTEMWERFSYYGMRALLVLYMVAPADKGGLGFDVAKAAAIYGMYTALVYATSLPGGWIADRFLGHYKAVFLGGVIITLGHISLTFSSLAFFYLGLALIVMGTGLLKPNITTLVGLLYDESDERRDAGFSIYYMGVNLGAFLAPLVCGTLGQKVGWHWGFGAAAVGMAAGLVQLHFGRSAFEAIKERMDKAQALAAQTGQVLSREEVKRLVVLAVLFIFNSLFWAAFEQAGSSLNLFADLKTQNEIFGQTFPSTWYQSLNPIFILMLAPVIASIWMMLGRRNPSSPFKFVLGLLFVGLGFLLLVPGSTLAESGLVGPGWLVGVYFLHTIGELCLSPVGLSIATRLAPVRFAGLIVGAWFLSISLGNYIGGHIAGLFETLPLPKLFGSVAGTTMAAAVALLLLVPTMNKWAGIGRPSPAP
jgi:proton-dependent oligopeptide transporter, POT family